MTVSADVVGRTDDGFRTAPRRQFAIVLRGEFELEASSGERRRGGAGDILLLEDVAGTGHRFQRVGDELLTMIAIGVADEWTCPGA
jgi:quercetin dioxygenase-like cupin family protein